MKIKMIFCISSILLIINLFVVVPLFAQVPPLVYTVENTGAACVKPALPTLANLKAYAMLPDPFAWANGSGRIASFADWECRRNEIKAQIENYEIGVKPPKPGNITDTWAAGTSTLTVKVTENGQTLTLTSKIVLPSGAGPFPAIIGMNSPTGSLPANVFSSRNIAQITYNHDQVTTYNNKSANDPFFKLYPTLASNGQYSAWAWGVSRIIDGLELVQAQLPIDLKHIGVTGCSYAGKMALFSGALDERIALTIPEESGGGGSAAWRVSETLGAVEKLGATNFQWFMQSMSQFQGNNVPKLPHDHHELLAMIAPRALLVLGNSPDWVWLAEEASYVSARAAEDVYKTLGIPDRFGFSQVGGHSHCEFPASQNADLGAFVDKFLLGKTTTNTTGLFKNLFPNTDYNKWITAWKGLVLPPPNNNGPVVSISAPLTNASYTEGDNITINATATIATGSIEKVNFYQGITLLGTDAVAPYTFTWPTVAAGNYQITAKATSLANDVTTSTVVNVLVTKAVFQTSAAPTIDGTIDAVWNNTTPVPITNLTAGTVSSATDLSGNWKAMWDATNLYVLVQVMDDVKRNDAGTDVYNDDGVEIYFDFGNTKAADYGTNDHQYTFRWNDATAAYEINNHPVTGISKGMTNTTTGYIVEVSIPWTTIGGVPTANSLQGFDVMLNDDDDGTARDGKMAWVATTDDTWDNPSLMGTIVLKALNCTPPAATITAVGTTIVCSGETVTLNANAGTGFVYAWKNGATAITGATAASYIASTAGLYTVTVTSGGCSATSTATVVTVNTLPAATITAGGSITFCTGGSVTLTATASSSYIWKNGNTQVGTAATYAATTAGSYTVEVTNANTCRATSTAIVITVNTAPAAPIVAATIAYCQSALATQLTATGTALKWYEVAIGGTALANTPVPVTTATGTKNYYVSQTITGCESARAQIAVTVNALPTVTITAGSATAFCTGGSVILTASAGSSYIWKNGTTQVGTAATYTATTAGSYTVEVTNASTCKATSQATVVTVNAAPAAPTVTSTVAYCQNATAIPLVATGNGLKWYEVATGGTAFTNTPVPITTATGTINYYVSQTNNGCESSRAALAVTVNALPVASVTAGAATTFCTGGYVLLTSSVGSSYKWMNGTTQVGTAATYSATVSGSYTVEITNAGNCKANSDAMLVTVNTLPVAIIIPVGSTAILDGGSVILNADAGSDLNYKWFKDNVAVATTASYVATVPGDYTVEVTNGSNCKANSSVIHVTTTQNQPSVVTITSPTQNSNVTGAVTIDVDVSDPDGTIILVEFLDGNTVIGSSRTAPYTFTWNNPSNGDHNITVRVTDSQGGVTTSSPVMVSTTSVSTGTRSSGTNIYSKVYPVPAHEQVLVETDINLSGASVRLISVLGEDIQVPVNINQKNATLDVSQLTAGTYCLIITQDSNILTTKISVIK